MRRWICWALTALMLTGPAAAVGEPHTTAAAVVLMDADSGRVLYERAGDEPRLIASITKLMTTLVALESGHELSEVVTIRPEWTGIEGSSLYLKPGEEITLETLLYGLLLRSGNDAAHAVAAYCGGSMERFVAAMNEKAGELGMTNTHFTNPSGLNEEGHHSSARDMALLARACLKDETLSQMVSTKTTTREGRVLTNHNKLLWRYEGCIGLKTGYTEKAGRTLVSAARRDGMTLICVTLNDPNDWADHAALFDYGFSHFQRRPLVQAEEVLGYLPLKGSLIPLCPLRAGADVWAALRPEEEPTVTLELSEPVVWPPLAAGTTVGRVVFTLAGEELCAVPLSTPWTLDSDLVPAGSSILERIFGR